MDRDEKIRLIAYQIWEEEGHLHGREVEHWLKAEAICQERQTEEQIVVSQPTAEGQTRRSRTKRQRP